MSIGFSQTKLISFFRHWATFSFKFRHASLKCCSFHCLQTRGCVKEVCHFTKLDARKFVERLLGNANCAGLGIVGSTVARVHL